MQRFYTEYRLKKQLDQIQEKSSDKELRELWPVLERKIPKLFEGLEITPALQHGDLWGGNAGQLESCPGTQNCMYGWLNDIFSCDISSASFSNINQKPNINPGFNTHHIKVPSNCRRCKYRIATWASLW